MVIKKLTVDASVRFKGIYVGEKRGEKILSKTRRLALIEPSTIHWIEKR
jgi:hypothetical protein